MKKMTVKFVIASLAILASLLPAPVLVSATYISGDLFLYENGEVRFEVETDIPVQVPGLTFSENKLTGTTFELLTFQSGSWNLDLSLEEYDDIFLNIRLPRGLEAITSIEGPDNIINFENRIITIIDSGKLDFTISYKLKEVQSFLWLFWPVLFIVIAIAYFIIRKRQRQKKHFEQITPFINDLERKIIDVLMEKPKRQKELRKSLNIPKASFSRYIANLEKKKLILREGEGKNKIVKLK